MTTSNETKGVLVVYRGYEVGAINAAAKHGGLRKTVTPHDTHLRAVLSWYLGDPKSPKQTGDYSNWTDEEKADMDALVDRMHLFY